jgi:c-di-GMP-binding flagellar brake protein YcgR
MVDSQQFLTVVVIIILIFSILFVAKNKRVTSQQATKKDVKQANRRDNFRIRVSIKNTVMEVLKIGSTYVNEHDYCEIVDVSAGGVGILSDYDFPLREKVYIKIHLYLNDEEFTLNGRIVRKIEKINKRSIFYGVQFINLSESDENRLIKEIVAMENRRRKISIK